MRTTRQVLVVLITVTFVAVTLSGLVFVFPARLLAVLPVSLLTWSSVHEWTALAFTLALIVHLVINRGRIAQLFSIRNRAGELKTVPAAKVAPPAAGSTVPTTAAGPQPTVPPTPDAPAAAASASAPQAASASMPSGGTPSPAEDRRPSRLNRRRFLVVGGVAAAGAVAAVTLDRTRSGGAPARSGGLARDFPALNVEQGPPAVGAADWELEVDGLVANPQRFDRAAWLAFPRAGETRDFRCVQGWGVEDLRWEGVRVADVLRRAEPMQEGKFVTFHAFGSKYSYTDTLTMAEALDADTLLADRLDGGALPAKNGGPLRLVIPSQLGYKNVKWVVRLEVTAERAEGFWEQRGYPADAPVV